MTRLRYDSAAAPQVVVGSRALSQRHALLMNKAHLVVAWEESLSLPAPSAFFCAQTIVFTLAAVSCHGFGMGLAFTKLIN